MALLPSGLALDKQSCHSVVHPARGTSAHPKSLLSTLLWKTFFFLGAVVVAYGAFILFLMNPWTQTELVYAYRIEPLHQGFIHPEDYGLAPGKGINLRIRETGIDATTLGAWFMMSTPFYRTLTFPPNHTESEEIDVIKRAISMSPTLLLFHGSTGTRAAHVRTSVYSSLTSRLSVNVLTLDYRGFGDSEGIPSVPGVTKDARAAWDWLTIEMGAKPENVVIVGHSLGTAIASILAAQLGREGVNVKGLALLAPFTSIRHLMDHLTFFHIPTPLKPLSYFPVLSRWITEMVAHSFDTLCEIPYITAPLLIAHARDDFLISSKHAEVLFHTILDPYLYSSRNTVTRTSSPPEAVVLSNVTDLTTLHSPHEDWEVITAAQAARAIRREKVIKRTQVPYFGVMQEFEAPSGRRITFLETEHGGHGIMHVEGVQDVLGRMFGLIH